MFSPLSLLLLALFAIPSLADENWGPPTSDCTTTTADWGDQPGWQGHPHHHPTTTTATDWIPEPTTDWLSTTAWVPTTLWVSGAPLTTTYPVTNTWSEVIEYTSWSLTTITLSYNTCPPGGCFETTTWSTLSYPASTFLTTIPETSWLGAAAPSTILWSTNLPSTTNGWTLVPPTGLTTYGAGSVVTYTSGTSTSLSTIGPGPSYTSFTSYSVETFISGTLTSLSTIGLTVATPVATGGAEREVKSGLGLGAAIMGGIGAVIALL